MNNVLVISGHPNLSESNTNQVILNTLETELAGVEIRALDSLYPDYNIDIEAEQTALLNADIVVLQFPFYWYSVPALLKKWIDDVFSYGFAYGSEGNKLQNKDFILSLTIGGPEEAYSPLGYNHFPIAQLLQPLEQTAYLAGMKFHKPVYSHGMVYIPGVYNELEEVQAKAKAHGIQLKDKIASLTTIDESYVESFVRKWFVAFDKMPEDSQQFTQHLATDVTWSMPEGDFKGHHGFVEWYNIALKQFKPNCDHQIQAISVQQHDKSFIVDLTVNLTAETYPESDFNGQPINIVAKETWHMSISPQGRLLIDNYQVALAE
ncbi:hypothetical protein tloyanaT_13930 [Thalassotalea loyana]|uniref:Flavodoxin-like fold domain-containing protein n=1 Tax=Thalassotalea loyana TaxID=280483 RepID=A0ABQ6HE30_9GAMM|nr:NAD(P)H-dependent oxidoreductase [Thalassotalea loyana]GLX85141.1 hypothetical protein tloyanaT_13930 [Thalassotalea loyana]